MTRRARLEFLDAVLRDELPADVDLIGRRPIGDGEHLAAGAYVALRIAMAFEAPLHLERLFLPGQRHSIDLTVAGRAAHALADMDAVIEVHEVRQIVYARPFERPVRLEARADRLEERAVREDLAVAIQAGLGRGDAGERGILDRRMAVTAIDAVAGDVTLMTELNRLFAGDLRVGDPRGAMDLGDQPQQSGDDEERAEDTDSGNGVGAAVKDLRHYNATRAVEGRSLTRLPRKRDSYFVKHFT
jgi:hypothetical protein